MTAEQFAALLSALVNIPGMGALLFIIVRQQRQIDALQQANMESGKVLSQANMDLIRQFMALHPPQDEPTPKS